jgi:hypothetical protein
MVEGRQDSRLAEKSVDSASLIKEETQPQNQVSYETVSSLVKLAALSRRLSPTVRLFFHRASKESAQPEAAVN